jgi:hypothetical protein
MAHERLLRRLMLLLVLLALQTTQRLRDSPEGSRKLFRTLMKPWQSKQNST